MEIPGQVLLQHILQLLQAVKLQVDAQALVDHLLHSVGIHFAAAGCGCLTGLVIAGQNSRRLHVQIQLQALAMLERIPFQLHVHV